jgi:hypothetical protein
VEKHIFPPLFWYILFGVRPETFELSESSSLGLSSCDCSGGELCPGPRLGKVQIAAEFF